MYITFTSLGASHITPYLCLLYKLESVAFIFKAKKGNVICVFTA